MVNQPIIQMKRRIEELLSQFKSINIELDDLQLENQIGAGGFGTVFKATRLSTSEIVAVKELRSNRLTMSSWASLYAEVETMASVRHPFVLELVGAHIKDPYRIITRFCPGKSLFDRLHRPNEEFPTLTPTKLTCIAYQVSVGMAHLHSMSIVHRDLKTLNILLDDEDDGCVADFGLSGMMKDNQELCGGVGTPHYTAPEVLSHSRYGPKVDIFSYAIVLWEMLTRQVPYREMSHMEIYEHVVTKGWRLPIPHETPEGIKKLITRCWSKNPNDRPQFSEIVSLFEMGEVFFPGSESINFHAVKSVSRCPPLNLDYLISKIKEPNDEHFSSLIYYICQRGDEKLRKYLRSEKILEIIMKSKNNIDAILAFASFILDNSEFEDFLQNGGLDMFKVCIETNNSQYLSAALRFALKIPKTELVQLKPFIPYIMQILQGNTAAIPHILQFITRFDVNELVDFKPQILKAIMEVISNVDDQPTFDAIVSLLPIIKDSLTNNQIRMFYRLLTCDLVVTPSFVSILIQNPDSWSHASLILSMLKATAKSDITDVLLQFLQKVSQTEKDVFHQLYKMQDFFNTIQELLDSGIARAPLFLLYCVSPILEAALKLAKHPTMQSLISMKGFQVQRLQIFTALCMHEKFCTETQYIDGIIHILVSSIRVRSLIDPSVRLIGAFSSHPGGCKLLSENRVLELFTQLFLTSWCGEPEISHTILRNIAVNHSAESSIPQGALIVSCLMQDLVYAANKTCEILNTIIALVETIPGCVQEHDLQKIVMPQLLQNQPLLVRLGLKLFTVVEPSAIRNIYPLLLSQIYKILSNPNNMYPEIIEECLKVIIMIQENFDISEYIEKTQITRFLNDVIKLLPNEDPHISEFANFIKDIERQLVIHV